MLTTSYLEDQRQLDIESVDKSTLVDIQTVHIDNSLSIAERAQRFCQLAKNPYAFRVGDVAVKIEYTQCDRTLREAITNYLVKIR